MHFVCCIKQVPDTAEVKIDPETNTLVRAGVESIANPYDSSDSERSVAYVSVVQDFSLPSGSPK